VLVDAVFPADWEKPVCLTHRAAMRLTTSYLALLTSFAMVDTLLVGGVHHGGDRVYGMYHHRATRGLGGAVSLSQHISKHPFMQPQLLAILCLMRYGDWTFPEAEVRLAEHTERRSSLRLLRVPNDPTVYLFLRRLKETALDNTLSAIVQRLALKPVPRQQSR